MKITRADFTPPATETPEVPWSELSPQEQAMFVRQGYRPPPMTIMSNAAYTEMENNDEHMG